MAKLEQCRGCGREVFHAAATCPQCGCPDPTPSRQQAAKGATTAAIWIIATPFLLCTGVPLLLCTGVLGKGPGDSAGMSSNELRISDDEMKRLNANPTFRGFNSAEKEYFAREVQQFDRAMQGLEQRRGY
jgi:hypothetical protein